ncbi:bis-aminopropyl spermidine synthase family protein [candidate division WWE3 bacterium]|uniref:Bis-aminopropyl spermidine synthase family protein n=1 Tax=candidate division WWE3 bacterium TaxID=2053526 RepID=A0A955ECD6_UNCKA|nr:bis-aminopropyl spermidine synthase family protein [candidate division WWE3 bacterium]
MTNNEILHLKSLNPLLSFSELFELLQALSKCSTSNELVSFTAIPKTQVLTFLQTLDTLVSTSSYDSIDALVSGLLEVSNAPFVSTVTPQQIETLRKYREQYKSAAKREFDQFFCVESDAFKKALTLISKYPPKYSSVVILGDDDFVSIALLLLGVEFKRLVVFDIDQQLLNYLNSIYAQHGKSAEFVYYDAANFVPKTYSNKFDAVVTDPPYTSAGVSLFLKRALQMLNSNSTPYGSIFLYHGASKGFMNRDRDVNKFIDGYNLVIDEKTPNFIKYTGAETVGNSSDLYILNTTSESHAYLVEDSTALYTNDTNKHVSFPFIQQVDVKLFDVSYDLTNSIQNLESAISTVCSVHRLKVVKKEVVKFEPVGKTLVYILSNSHLVVHTWPESNNVHIDLTVCKPLYKPEEIFDTLKKVFHTSKLKGVIR